MLLMLMEGFPTFLNKSARSMPVTSAVKSGGVAGVGVGALVATTAVVGDAGPGGLGASSTLAAPASEVPSLSKILAEDLPAPAAAAEPERPAVTPYSIIAWA